MKNLQASIKLYWFQFLDPSFRDLEIREKEISRFDFLIINWLLAMVKTFYVLGIVLFGAFAPQFFGFSSLQNSGGFFRGMNFNTERLSIFFALLELVVFPVALYFLYRFWVALLKFFAELFEYDKEDILEACRQVAKRSYTVNFLFLLPIVGSSLSIFAQGLYLYLGMKNRLEFTNMQAILVLFVPLFLLVCLLILAVSYMIFIFSTLFSA